MHSLFVSQSRKKAKLYEGETPQTFMLAVVGNNKKKESLLKSHN